MALGETDRRSVSREDALEQTVADVMLRNPKAWPLDARVAEIRRAFERPSVRTVLLTDGTRFAGAIDRGSLPEDAPDDAPAADYLVPDPVTVRGDLPMSEAIALLAPLPEPRLIVLDDDGATLRGLVCANADASGFCAR